MLSLKLCNGNIECHIYDILNFLDSRKMTHCFGLGVTMYCVSRAGKKNETNPDYYRGRAVMLNKGKKLGIFWANLGHTVQ